MTRPTATPAHSPRHEAPPAPPGRATFRGAPVTLAAADTPVPDVGRAGALRATGRTRRVRLLGRRLPVLTGYSGGPIPTDVHGTVRVGGPTAVFWVLLATTSAALTAGLTANAAHSLRGLLATIAGYLVANAVAAHLLAPR